VSDSRPNIWLLQAQGDSRGLIDALQNSDTDVHKRAAAALRALGAVESVMALRRALENETDEDTRLHLDMALNSLLIDQYEAETEQGQQTRQLVAQLKSTDPAIILKAAHGLGTLKDKTAVEALVLLFNNTQLPANVRLTAAEALIELDSAPAVVTLLAALKSPSWKIRRSAAGILGQMRANWSVERLAERLRDENEYVQRTARAALQHIGTAEATKAIDLYERELKRKTASMNAVKPEPIAESVPVYEPQPKILASVEQPVTPDAEPDAPEPAVETPPVNEPQTEPPASVEQPISESSDNPPSA
jgi:HEAT repeat protein